MLDLTSMFKQFNNLVITNGFYDISNGLKLSMPYQRVLQRYLKCVGLCVG